MKARSRRSPLWPSATLNFAARANIAHLSRLLRTEKEPLLLNLGSGDRFIGAEGLDEAEAQRMVNFDLAPCAGVRVVGDAHGLPFGDGAFHGVICQAVLEHTRRPEAVVKEIGRVLKPGGLVYIETPFLQGYHPTPTDYYRFTEEGLAELLSGFERVDSGVCAGPSSSLSWLLREYIAGLVTGFAPAGPLRGMAVLAAAWLTFPLKYLDLLVGRRPGAAAIASGLFFLGRKK
ncbi:MAG: class I SAM-dependent methyltransferase [Candidatus Aminicenantes bacterium]|nr:class I SAM-dependent methyltransferase [Candidatus Aminicenantes bacterium]